MAANEGTGVSGSPRDADDELNAPPNKVRNVCFSDSGESDVVASGSSHEIQMTQGTSDNENVNATENESPNIREDDNESPGESEAANMETREELEVEGNENEDEENSEQQTDGDEINYRTLNFEAYSSFWPNKTLCAMLLRKSATPEPQAQASSAVEVNAERRPILIGLRLSTSASATPASYLLRVDENFRSDQVKWELKAFDSKRKESDWEIFKGAGDSRIETHYPELLPSTELTNTKSNGAAEDHLREDRQNSPDELQVEIKRKTYREAVIEWSVEPPLSTDVDKWLVVIRNEGRTPSNSSDYVQTSEWMIIFKPQPSQVTCRIDNDLVKLEYQAGHKYSVQVIGLQLKHKDLPNNGVECYGVIAFSDKSFRAENTEEDYKHLLSMARQIRDYPRYPASITCQYLYRDKTSRYFDDLKANNNNVMEVYVKDANGDPAAAIHGLLKGLFFSAKVKFPFGRPKSPFGDKRVLIPPKKLITEDTNVYFGDFYCLNSTHLVTLVVTRSNSEADVFCKEKKLPLLGRTETENPFLYFSSGEGSASVSLQITVEVFYTENIDLKELSSRYDGEWEQFYGWKDNRRGNRWKTSYCSDCNLYTTRIPDAFLV